MITSVDVEEFADRLKEFGISTCVSRKMSLTHKGKIPLRYESYSLAYQREYWLRSGYKELSERTLNSENLYWPLVLSRENSGERISSDGKNLFPPILLGPKTSQSAYQRIQLSCLGLLEKLSANYEIGQIELRSDFQSHAHPWVEFAINNNLKIQSSFEDVLSLGGSNQKIFANFKDSTRRDVNKGLELFHIEVLDAEGGANNLERLRDLHELVSGRVTRESITWELQAQNLLNDRALLILCKENISRELISGSYFEFNELEASYGVSATNRDYFKTPVNHAMQWKAIEYFNSRDIEFYRLGKRHNTGVEDLKLQNISKFKRKFASHFESIFTFDLNSWEA
jgi:FemAB family protein